MVACWGEYLRSTSIRHLAPKALHHKVSGLKDRKQQGPGTLRPHHRDASPFRVPKAIMTVLGRTHVPNG